MLNGKSIKRLFLGSLLVFHLGSISACDSEKNENSNSQDTSDSGASGDSGSTDETTDSSTNPTNDQKEGVCISSISGKVLLSDGTPLNGAIGLCPKFICYPVPTEADGTFFWKARPDGSCQYFDVEKKPMHLSVGSEEHAIFSYSFAPTQEEVSDEGTDDYALDIGTFDLYVLDDDDGADYFMDEGVAVNSNGLVFNLAPGQLKQPDPDTDTETAEPKPTTIRVLKIPDDGPKMRFDDVGADLLYHVAPYWGKIEDGGIQMTISTPAEWVDGDIVEIYMLGELLGGLAGGVDYIYQLENGTCANDSNDEGAPIHEGEFKTCGTATVQGGELLTPPIPRLGWIGLKKK